MVWHSCLQCFVFLGCPMFQFVSVSRKKSRSMIVIQRRNELMHRNSTEEESELKMQSNAHNSKRKQAKQNKSMKLEKFVFVVSLLRVSLFFFDSFFGRTLSFVHSVTWNDRASQIMVHMRYVVAFFLVIVLCFVSFYITYTHMDASNADQTVAYLSALRVMVARQLRFGISTLVWISFRFTPFLLDSKFHRLTSSMPLHTLCCVCFTCSCLVSNLTSLM